MPRKEQKSLLCSQCGLQQATIIHCFEKYHKESGNKSLVDPQALCDTCFIEWEAAAPLFPDKPLIINLKKLAAMRQLNAVKKIGYLTSKKKWESNHLSTSFWRDKIWNALYWHRGELKRIATNGG